MSSQPEEGKDKCPYGPTTGYTALIVGKPFNSWLGQISSKIQKMQKMLIVLFFLSDQQMFTASQYEFRSFPDIRRNSPSPMLRAEDAPTRWLNGE